MKIVINGRYRTPDKPEYRRGHAVMIALNTLSFFCTFLCFHNTLTVVTWVMVFWLKSENKRIELHAQRRGTDPFKYMI
jgi:hypothetical protein